MEPSNRGQWHFRRQATVSIAAAIAAVLVGCGARHGPGTNPSKLPTVTVTSTTYTTAGAPFQALPSSSGQVFVAVSEDGTPGSATGVQVFVSGQSGLQSSCVNTLPPELLALDAGPANLSFFPGGKDLAAGIGYPGAIFYHTSDVLGCNASGFVVDQGSTSSMDEGTLAVAVTPDGKFAFVENEYGIAPGATTIGNIGVVAIERDTNGDFTSGTKLIGQIATGGNAIAGMKLSPDGTRLYVTSQIAASGTIASGSGNPILSKSGCVQRPGGRSNVNGLLTVIDVAKAEAAPGSGAILATIAAGCSPVRMAQTADGKTLWVAARGDDRVLAFSTARLESSPDDALSGYASSGGAAPVGIALFHNDQLLAVANSNRFNTGTANLTILFVAAPANATVLQTVSTGLFPREVNVGADDATLYLTNFLSDSLQVVQTAVHP